jgi:hypothetical protein
MSNRQPANIPIALSRARRQLDHWRSRQRSKRARLPKELWRQAVALAREHGLPFNRLVRLQGSLGIPLPAATQWEIVERTAGVIEPVFREMIRDMGRQIETNRRCVFQMEQFFKKYIPME